MSCHSDLIVLGGGCAGLSLGMNLTKFGENSPRTTILEGRTHYTNDRTWCFWGGLGSDSEEFSTHRWESFSITTNKARITRHCEETPYLMVSSKDFYQTAQRLIYESPRIDLKLGSLITGEIFKRKGLWYVSTPSGEYSAPWVVDTRPGSFPLVHHSAASNPMLWQSFLGEELTTEEDLFDPGCVELMDFSGSFPETILFLYVLPFSKREALVEATVFGPRPLRAEELEEPLRSLTKNRLHGIQALSGRREHGILPMGTKETIGRMKQQAEDFGNDPSYVRAGLMAGGARPSSGYAFQRIWKWSQECAVSLITGKPPKPHPHDHPLTRAMDALFLRVLSSNPELAPDLFFSLFAKVDPARVARFMNDQGTLSDCAVIMASLPPTPFLQELATAAGLPFGKRKSHIP